MKHGKNKMRNIQTIKKQDISKCVISIKYMTKT